MFFRRVFSRRERSDSNEQTNDCNRAMQKDLISDEKRNQNMIQLTPLWEHIIRTKSLPENTNEIDMFAEFSERLRDPEWQVRQHALKVLVDVLIVMGERSDQYFQPLICPLVENLGNSAPAIRKGSLDALKVYMTETAMPETIILEIINLGMEQKKYCQKFDGRICVGVILSLPSLVYTSLGTPKQNHIVRAVIEALTNKMIQVTFQEIALKVLLRIREMIGVREFSEHIAHGAYRDFELLCNVYGLPSTPDIQTDPSVDLYKSHSSSESLRVWNPKHSSANESNCKVVRTELCWRDNDMETSADEENNINNSNQIERSVDCMGENVNKQCDQTLGITSEKPKNEKIIMETEIKIQDTALTMRILEANSNSSENEVPGESSEDDEQNGVVRILTDSEVDDSNGTVYEVLDSARNPLKRVTFGGEEVKLRTPDSDSVLQSDNDDAQKAIQRLNSFDAEILNVNSTNDYESELKLATNTSFLTVNRPRTTGTIIPIPKVYIIEDKTIQNNKMRHQSASPIRKTRRHNSTDEMIISPKASHKGIEVLHNLQQRSPSVSPTRSRRSSLVENKSCEQANDPNLKNTIMTPEVTKNKLNDIVVEEISSPELNNNLTREQKKSWEDLGLVDELCLRNLRSGVSFHWNQNNPFLLFSSYQS